MSTCRHCLMLLPALLLSGCGGDAGDEPDNGSRGQLSLAITDAPVDGAEALHITFTGVELHHAHGERYTIDFTPAKRIDLLTLQGGRFDYLLEEQSITAGNYQSLRLKLATDTNDTALSAITLSDGSTYPLHLSRDMAQGLTLKGGFNIPEGENTTLTIDFDLRRSVLEPDPGFISGGDEPYRLRPVLRLIDNDNAAALSGAMEATLTSSCASPAVYLYRHHNVTPYDLANESDPLLSLNLITSTPIRYNGATSTHEYSIGFISAGDYTIAYTCEAEQDRPEARDAISFSGNANITLSAGDNARHDFN